MGPALRDGSPSLGGRPLPKRSLEQEARGERHRTERGQVRRPRMSTPRKGSGCASVRAGSEGLRHGTRGGVDRLSDLPLVLVTGASGSGKTRACAFVRNAAVVPAYDYSLEEG